MQCLHGHAPAPPKLETSATKRVTSWSRPTDYKMPTSGIHPPGLSYFQSPPKLPYFQYGIPYINLHLPLFLGGGYPHILNPFLTNLAPVQRVPSSSTIGRLIQIYLKKINEIVNLMNFPANESVSINFRFEFNNLFGEILN